MRLGLRWISEWAAVGGVVVGGVASAQEAQVPTLRTGTSIVLVPAAVRTKAGEPVFTLGAKDFLVTDDGVEQKIRLEDEDQQPMALVVVVEETDTAEGKFKDYAGLGKMIDLLVGGEADHRVAVVAFDSEPEVIQGFTSDVDKAEFSLGKLDEGDGGAATLDALTMAVGLLKKQPLKYRRAILLVSETVDRGSHVALNVALRNVSDSNTVIYSLGYSSSKAATKHELGQSVSSSEAGPPRGCMGRYPDTDLEGNPLPGTADPRAQGSHANNRAVQAYDCLSLLAPPLRLAKIGVMVAMNSLKQNVPEAAARITGGEYFKAENAKTMEKDLMAISNHLPNRYFLSFTPSATHAGFHAIEVKLREPREGVRVEARTGYWESSGVR